VEDAGFRDITEGNNGDFSAAEGWDACTGLGSPNGSGLLGALTAPPSAQSTATQAGKKRPAA
jgi:kumamolisin